MQTKNQVQSASNDNIKDDVLIIPSMHREANDAMIDNSYGSILPDTQATETFTEKVITSATYSINVVKQGRVVHVHGSFKTNVNTTLSPSPIFQFKSASELFQYLEPDDATDTLTGGVKRYYGWARSNVNNEIWSQNIYELRISLYKTSGGVWVFSSTDNIPPITSGNYFSFSLTYTCKN